VEEQYDLFRGQIVRSNIPKNENYILNDWESPRVIETRNVEQFGNSTNVTAIDHDTLGNDASKSAAM
jgi:hypothetical protein